MPICPIFAYAYSNDCCGWQKGGLKKRLRRRSFNHSIQRKNYARCCRFVFHLAYLAGKEACKQAKITIYVPYEKWREMVGGHEAWVKLADYGTRTVRELSEEEKQKYPSTFNFKGVEYHLEYLIHKRVLVYESGYYKFNDYANLDSVLYYDWETKTVLYQYTRFPKNYSSGLTVSNLLGIRSGHKECEPKEEHDTHAYYFYRK